MGLPGHDCDVKSSGQACDKWSLEWTYGASGAVTLDTSTGEGGAWTDFDPRIAEADAVTDGGTGLTNIRFPASRRARVAHISIEPATPGTDTHHVRPVVTALDPLTGTCVIAISAHNSGTLTDPASGSRGRLVLDLEYR